jgi:hypothetical protein
VVAGGARLVLKIVCVEPPPSAVHAKAKAPAPHFSCFAGGPQAHEELFSVKKYAGFRKIFS